MLAVHKTETFIPRPPALKNSMSTQGQVYGVFAGLLVAGAIGWFVSQDIIFTVAVMPIGIVIGSIIGGRIG